MRLLLEAKAEVDAQDEVRFVFILVHSKYTLFAFVSVFHKRAGADFEKCRTVGLPSSSPLNMGTVLWCAG